MNVLVIGFCGSMGKRRIRCLRSLGIDRIFGLDVHPEKNEIARKLEIELLESVEDFSGTHAVISTPPDLHIDYAKQLLNKGCHVFCEASVVPSDRYHYPEIEALSSTSSALFFPSATIKFKDSILFIKEKLEAIGDIHSYDYRFAQNLRTWHPYQDINDYYVSKHSTGAGREMAAFELAWLTDIFGTDCSILGSSVSSLSEIGKETNINDHYSFIINHGSTIGTISIDVFSHLPYRVLRISGSEGNIEFDWVDNSVKVFDSRKTLVEEYSESDNGVHDGYTQFSTEKMYINEVKNFLESAGGIIDPKCTVDIDYKILSLVEEIEASG